MGDRNKIKLKTLRTLSKQLGVANAGKLGKSSLLKELTRIEKSKGITPNSKSIPRQTGGFLLDQNKNCITSLNHNKKNQNKNLSVIQPSQLHAQRYKGLTNLGKTCYFNSVLQCLPHCPKFKHAIETLPPNKLSITVLRELRILFTKMTSSDSSTTISPFECLYAVLNTRECKAVHLGEDNAEEDVNELLLRLPEHFHEQLCSDGTTTLTDMFNINRK